MPSESLPLEDVVTRPGVYFNPQTEVLIVVDDSAEIDGEIFNMEDYEGSDWVDDLGRGPGRRGPPRRAAPGVPDALPRRRRPQRQPTANELEDEDDDEEEGQEVGRED